MLVYPCDSQAMMPVYLAVECILGLIILSTMPSTHYKDLCGEIQQNP